MTIHLLHGALGSGTTLVPLKTALETRGCTCIIHEFPGHGETPIGDTEFSIVGFAKWLKQELADEPEQVNVFGYSMGGYVALKMEEMFPGTINYLYTLGTKFAWTPESASKETSRLRPDVIEVKVPAFANMLAKRHSNWRFVVNATAELMICIPTRDSLDAKRLKESTGMKTWLSRGTLDTMVTQAETDEMSKNLDAIHVEHAEMPHPIEQVDVEILASDLLNRLANR